MSADNMRALAIHAPKMPGTSIRRSLVLGSVALVVAAFAICAVTIYGTIYRPLLGELTSTEMRRASEKVTDDVQAIFTRMEAIAARHRDWGAKGLISIDDLHGFNDLFSPLLRGDIGITSIALAQDSGRELLIVATTGNGWSNRFTNPDAWGRRARFLTWNERGELIIDEQKDFDYDARKRPWFIEAMGQTSDSGIYWTAPYRFVSTDKLGISAVIRWSAPDGHTYAMTTDMTLADLTRFTQQIDVGKSGLATVLTGDGTVLAVPRDPRLKTADAIAAMIFQPVQKLGIPPLTKAFATWQARGRPEMEVVKFGVGSALWLTSFYPIHLGAETLWVATLAPVSDFGTLTSHTLALAAAFGIGSLLLASLGAAWLGSRFSRPIEQLTAESARIGRMDLRDPIDVTSPVREIDALARSLETMRLNLVKARAEAEARIQLERQLEQAQKVEALGRLAGGIAHDFNNLLGAMLGFAGFLVQDLPKGSEEHRFATQIWLAAQRGTDIVRQILAFSRTTGVERSPHDLGRVLIDMKPLLRAALPSSTELDVAIQAQGLTANLNVGQITQLLLNLCLNANDAMEGRPGRIDITLAPAPAEVEAGPPGSARLAIGVLDARRHYARITVADTGIGMTNDVLKKIFEPFFTTKERGRGTGFGLAIVHSIVTAYGGACVVTSAPGKGSTFQIYIPVGEVETAGAGTDAAGAGLHGREHILIVDDETIITDMLSTGLERLGYEVGAVNGPEEAIEILAEDPTAWDIVVSDQVMPRMKGLALFERMRAIQPSLRFILCTGFSDGTTEEVSLKAGVSAFFLKPVSAEQLAAGIRRLMDAPGRGTPAA